ncbi:hypothetical protein MYX78_04395 [Acidobacteria bacterium AH-259-G07]|nr:hypothetical protein [Acidobacteria bacterium AH-259-G07]
MTSTLEDLLEPVAKYLSDDLASPDSLRRCCEIARSLPVLPAAGFECSLDDSIDSLDFAVCASVSNGGREILAGKHPNYQLSQRLLAHPVWRGVRDLAARWKNPESVLHDHLKQVWLEFDLKDASCLFPVPGVHLSFKDSWCKHSPREYSAVLQDVFDLLLEDSPSNVHCENVRRCISTLPAPAHLCHVGVLLSRENSMTRLVVCNFPFQELRSYSAAVSLQLAAAELPDVVLKAIRLADVCSLNLDVGDEISPKVGVEIHFDKQPASSRNWETVLDYLVDETLCTFAKRNALLNWPAYSIPSSSDSCQLLFGKASSFLGSRAGLVLIRLLNHIKLVYIPGCVVQAKAYFGFVYKLVLKSKA